MKYILLSVLVIAAQQAQAVWVDWSGTYRFEYFDINKPSLDGGDSKTKSYGIHFLTLQPTILASDGISIVSRLEFLTNKSPDYADSQIGQTWGGSDYGKPASGNGGVNNVTRSNQINTNVKIRELFLKVEQELGIFLLGRAPYEFGLGITHNAGDGAFDHWYDTKDLLAYKFYIGNVSIMPMLSRTFDKSPDKGQMNQEETLEILYDNKDAGATIGVLFERKHAAASVVADNVNDDWALAINKGVAPTARGGFNFERTTFLLGRKWETFDFMVEAAFEKGETGYVNAAGEEIEMNAYGIATEFNYQETNSKWRYGLLMGVASGDNPGSTKFEGFQFDRNYDVAMLLFNHRLGQADFLRTNIIKNRNLDAGNSFDDEAISNASYLSLRFDYDWKEKWKWGSRLTYAQLMDKIDSASDMKKDLGLELDLSLTYKPRERVQWVNEIGILSPGSAFKNGSAGLGAEMAFGFASKAAISF